MKVLFLNNYLVGSVIFVLSYGATINLNGIELGKEEENFPYKYDIINSDTQSSSDSICSKPVDCAEVYNNGFRKNGVYNIYPINKVLSCGELRVYCDMETDGGGWTVIQRRGDFNRSEDYFYKTWEEYKTGFGHIEKDFWLGNDYIYALTNQKRYSVRFDLGTQGDTAYATYDTFWIENEELKYRLYITDYTGTAGDSMELHHKRNFSTKYRPNQNATTYCTDIRKGSWWFDDCAQTNLNGDYLKGNNYNGTTVRNKGIFWSSWKGYRTPLTKVEIKIRPFEFLNVKQ